MGERNKRVFELMREHNLRKVDIAECLGISKSAVTQSDKEKFALWHSVIDHIEFDMDGNITEIFYIH